MSKEPIQFLRHIADECAFLLSIGTNLTKDDFLDNETLKRAVVRSLEIIGEATKKFLLILKSNGMQLNGKTWLE